MRMCKKCSMICGILWLFAGIGFLLQDLDKWNFWHINWWSVAFLILGLAKFGKSKCGDCQKCK